MLAYDSNETAEAAARLQRPGGSPEHLHQDPRHAPGAGGDHRVDRGRDPDQRDAALRRRSVPRPGGRLHTRNRAPDRARRDPDVASVASIFVSRWDVAVADGVPAELKDRLGVAVAIKAYVAYRELLASERWQRLAERGRAAAAAPVRLDRHQGPVAAEDEVRASSSRLPTPSTRCPRRRCWRSPRRTTIGGVLADDGGDNEELLARSRRPGSTSTRSPSSSSPRVPRSSRPPGTTCSTASRASSARSGPPVESPNPGAGGRVRHAVAAGLAGARRQPAQP